MKSIKSRSRFACNTVTGVTASLMVAQLHAATLSIPNVPVFLGTQVSPNVSFVLDNSGSMAWTWLPDAALNFRSTNTFRFTNGGGLTTDSVGNYYLYQSMIGPTNGKYGLYSTHCNGAHYNPLVTYTPPLDANGAPLPNATYTAAYADGFNTTLGTVNLSTLSIRTGYNGGFYYQYTGVEPTLNFQYTTAGAAITNTFFNQCNSAIGSAPGNAVFTLIPINTASATVQQNYANWFSYYRTRMQAMKSGAGRAFAGLTSTYRVGFQTINNNSSGANTTGANFLNTQPFTAANKTAWFNQFYGITPGGGTPLRTALMNAGEYYRTGVMPGAAGSVDPVIQACQKNYTILSSDGYWNGAAPTVGNRDNTVPTLPAPVTGLTTGSNWPFPYREGTAAVSNTLADVATFYWATDLRTGMADTVPGDLSDPAKWQHMTTYTVGFGLKGTLDFPGARTGLDSGATRWPTPVADTPSAVDDLWHAGLNGFGGYLSAQDPNALTTALQSALADLAARVTSSSSVAANTTSIQAGTRVYQARFDSGSWTGQLLSYTLSSSGALSATFEWDAGVQVTSQTGINSDSRFILTNNGGGVPFQWASLSVSQQNALRTPPLGGPLDTAAVGQQRLEYLRGWSANEGSSAGQFRARPTGKLGDIIDSNPWYVGQPQGSYSDEDHPGYFAFFTSYQNRTPVIYLGANDGMLHGFDASYTWSDTNSLVDSDGDGNLTNDQDTSQPTANSGKEVLGYVPNRLFDKLSKLTGQTYNGSHQYYVNSSPMLGDADFSGGLGSGWKTVLVSGLGQGGQGYFALNVTDPANFTVANAATLALWEFTDQNDADLGYTFNQPTIQRLNGQAAQIVKMNNNKWAVVVGNGYNNTQADSNVSTTGHGVLYILFLSNSFSGTWTLGTDYIKLDTGSGTVASPNGLATPLPVDTNGDKKVDVIYAGDLNGNMWKFDVSATTAASWNVANSGSPLFVTQSGQPITSAPQVSAHPSGGRMVLFGSGKFIETADATGPFTTQSLYGVWDNGTTVSFANLVQQTLTSTVAGAGTDFRTVSSNAVNYAGTAKGWYLNLTAGETTPFNTITQGGLALYSTMVPSSNPCTFGGEGWLMALDPLTGWASSAGSFDANGDGVITAMESIGATSVGIAGRKSTVGIAPTPTLLSGPTSGGSPGSAGIYDGAGADSAGGGAAGGGGGAAGGGAGGSGVVSTVYANGTGGLERFTISGPNKPRGRIMWKEIF